MLQLWATVDLGVMAMKRYSAFTKVPVFLLFSVISRTHVGEEGSLTSLQKSSRCILQLQPTGLSFLEINVLRGFIWSLTGIISTNKCELFILNNFWREVLCIIAFIYPTPAPLVRCDTKSIFKRSKPRWNLDFFFFLLIDWLPNQS